MRRWRRALLIPVLLFLSLGLFLGYAGRFLVVDQPQPSDAIVVLAGGHDNRYYKGLQMLGKGYGKILFLDANTDFVQFGRTPFSMGQTFIQTSSGALLDRARMCPV